MISITADVSNAIAKYERYFGYRPQIGDISTSYKQPGDYVADIENAIRTKTPVFGGVYRDVIPRKKSKRNSGKDDGPANTPAPIRELSTNSEKRSNGTPRVTSKKDTASAAASLDKPVRKPGKSSVKSPRGSEGNSESNSGSNPGKFKGTPMAASGNTPKKNPGKKAVVEKSKGTPKKGSAKESRKKATGEVIPEEPKKKSSKRESKRAPGKEPGKRSQEKSGKETSRDGSKKSSGNDTPAKKLKSAFAEV